jgi:protein-tyrosine phosphatase
MRVPLRDQSIPGGDLANSSLGSRMTSMKRNFSDFHCHLLPSIDDGAIDQRDSLEMARALAGFGFTTVYCTPHLIKGGFENPPERVRQATHTLQQILDDAGISLRLVSGTEHYLDEFLPDLIPGALAVGSSRYLLLEVPFRSGAEMVPALMANLSKRGLLPLFAHPERCRAFQAPLGSGGVFSFMSRWRKEPDLTGSLITSLKQSGCRFQGNIGSFAGVYGSEVKRQALFFLTEGVYSCLGSDAHTSQGLAQILSSGFEVIVEAVGEAAAWQLLQGFEA